MTMSDTPGFSMLVGGELIDSDRHFDVINPATGGVLAACPAAGPALLDRAIDAAAAALPAWRDMPIDGRRAVLRAVGDTLAAHAAKLAELFTREQGRPLALARQEIAGAGEWFHGVAAFDLPVEVVEDSLTRRTEIHWEPLGIVCAIVPWNFPVMLAAWKLAPALLAGNCVVLKPSPFTPLTTLRIGELLQSVVPPGVLNILTGTDELGPMMTAHPGFAKISFTGSSETGRRVMATAAQDLKNVTLELGGNDAAIVLADNDPESIADALLFGAFFNSGQICMATKRLYVHDAIYDAVRDALAARIARAPVGNGLDEGVLFGPVQNRPQYERVLQLLEDCRANGYSLLSGPAPEASEGYFLPLTIVDNPPEASRVVQEEAFGPILPMLRFASTDNVITLANASPYGLGATVWSRDVETAVSVAKRLQCGTVWINHNLDGHPEMTVSGRKQSGIGTENGASGLRSFAAPKAILIPK